MRRILERSALFLVAVLMATFVGDWAVLQLRMARHSAFSTVQVDQFVAASIKGNKQEYFHAGTLQEPCVKSIFPHGADAPCWWLRRHTMQWKVIGAVTPERLRRKREERLC